MENRVNRSICRGHDNQQLFDLFDGRGLRLQFYLIALENYYVWEFLGVNHNYCRSYHCSQIRELVNHAIVQKIEHPSSFACTGMLRKLVSSA